MELDYRRLEIRNRDFNLYGRDREILEKFPLIKFNHSCVVEVF